MPQTSPASPHREGKANRCEEVSPADAADQRYQSLKGNIIMSNPKTMNRRGVAIAMEFVRTMRRLGHTRSEALEFINVAEAELCKTTTAPTRPDGRYFITSAGE